MEEISGRVVDFAKGSFSTVSPLFCWIVEITAVFAISAAVLQSNERFLS